MHDLTVFGDPVMDDIYDLADPVRPGGKMLGRFVAAVPGGTTANVACAAARLGLDVAMVGRVAHGAEGALHRRALAQAGVACDLSDVALPRGTHCVVALNPDGEKTVIYVPVDAPAVPAGLIRAALDNTRMAYVMAADVALLAGQLPCGAVICVDADAAAGLDAAGFAALRGSVDVVFINDVGFHKLTGQPPDAAGLANLAGPRAGVVCCTGGAGTTWLWTRANNHPQVHTRPALPARVVDTTGAGDCFNAAFLTRLAEGAAPVAALDFAMAAGALATQTLGARASAPSRAAVEAKMAAPNSL